MSDTTTPDGTPADTKDPQFSVRKKIGLVVSIIFLLVSISVSVYSYHQNRATNLERGIAQVKAMNAYYFDSVNTLMLADVMEERDVLRRKILELPGIEDVRLIRSPVVTRKFGDGLPGQQPVDDLDRRAMQGESIVRIEDADAGRAIVLLEPYRITENTRGTDCTECHRRVESGAVAGAVRLRYSLAAEDSAVLAGFWKGLAVNFSLFVLGLLALTVILNRSIARPVRMLMGKMERVSTGDLNQRCTFTSRDELGTLGSWFNRFLSNIGSMVTEILGQVHNLSNVVKHMNQISQQTQELAARQRKETGLVLQATEDMSKAVEAASQSANEAASIAATASSEANAGKRLMDDTMSSIQLLANEISWAGDVIADAEQESNNISSVLDVIGGIAEQTNLLALNAAIEAARAGEQGRGFAVVADEVRTLAERTQTSTLEIQRMIESLQKRSKGAVEAMSQSKQRAEESVEKAEVASKSLQTTIGSVDGIAEKNRYIADAIEDHRRVSEGINASVMKIDEVAALASAEAAEVASTSRRISGVAQQLEGLMTQFSVKD